MNSIVLVLVVVCVWISAKTTSAVPYHDHVAETASNTKVEARDKRQQPQANFGITITLTTSTITYTNYLNYTVPTTCYTTASGTTVTKCSRAGRSLTMPLSTINPDQPEMMYRTASPTVHRTGKESDQMVGQTLLPSFAEEERLLPKGRVFWNIETATITQTTNVITTVTETKNIVTLEINGDCIPVDIEKEGKCKQTQTVGSNSRRRPVLRGRLPPHGLG